MKIVGQMSITNFPLWEMCLNELSNHVDELYLRFDINTGDPKILKIIKDPKFMNGKIKNVLISDIKWNRWNWREEQLRMLDNIKPDILMVPDQDETFCDGIDDEIKDFWSSDKKAMMLSFVAPMPTDDGRIINGGKSYPGKPHMKIYKWQPKLTYHPYCSFAKVTTYRNPQCHWIAKTRMKHFCYYTKELQNAKKISLQKRFEYERIHGTR